MTCTFWISFLFLTSVHAEETINMIFTNEDTNIIGEKSFDAAVAYLNANESFGVKVEVEKVALTGNDPQFLLKSWCTIYNKMIDDNIPPHVMIDFTKTGVPSETAKSVAVALAIPTVSASFGQEGNIRMWRDLNPNEDTYLVQVMPPADVIPAIITNLVQKLYLSNAAVLYDDSFVMEHKQKSLLSTTPASLAIEPLRFDALKDQFEDLRKRDFGNFFILGNLTSLVAAIDVGCTLGYFVGSKFSWYLITQEDHYFQKTSCKFGVMTFVKPIPDGEVKGRVGTLKAVYGVDWTPEVEAAFYFDLTVKAIDAVRNLLTNQKYVNMTYLKCSEYSSNTPTRDLDLQQSLKEAKPIPETYGPIIIEKNGKSHMPFKMDLRTLTLKNDGLEKTDPFGTWTASLESEVAFSRAVATKDDDMKGKKYTIVTRIQPPFVYKDDVGNFQGFAVDILKRCKRQLGFDFTLYEVPDKKWGYMDEKGNWNGLVKELIDKKADFAIGSISLMAERESVIDYTTPYYDLVGITILMKKPQQNKSIWKFLSVLENEVWYCILAAYFFTSFLIWIFDKYSPYSYQNNMEKYKDDDEKRLFNARECLWFSITSLTPQGGGEAPKNLSGRLVAATWWLFGFIIIASYTANLAAFLTVSRLDAPINTLEDLSRQFKVSYAPINGSTEMLYFERMSGVEEMFYDVWKDMSLNDSLTEVERSKLAVWDYPVSDKYTKIWQAMKEIKLPENLEEAIHRVKSSRSANEGFALIADATDAMWYEMTDCDVHVVGPQFSKKPYAFMTQKGSPIRQVLNSMIFNILQDKRYYESLKKKWWDDNPLAKHCPKIESAEDGISLADIAGVFAVIFIGILIALAILIVEFIFYRHKEVKIINLQSNLMQYVAEESNRKSKGKDSARKLIPAEFNVKKADFKTKF